jgi:hypothetical protein
MSLNNVSGRWGRCPDPVPAAAGIGSAGGSGLKGQWRSSVKNINDHTVKNPVRLRMPMVLHGTAYTSSVLS